MKPFQSSLKSFVFFCLNVGFKMSRRHPDVDWSFIIQLMVYMIFATPSSVWANLQNLPVAKGTITAKFPFILASAKEVDKLKEDKECLHCFQESEMVKKLLNG